jgi:dienelactone hydrolase
MRHRIQLLPICLAMAIASQSCNNSGTTNNEKEDASKDTVLKEEEVTYNSGSITMKGYVVYNENIKEKRPAVLVVHEWWGLNDYTKSRARQLAKLGYVAMAVDMYGDGKTAADPQTAQALATPFYSDPQLAKKRLDAAEQKIKQLQQTDTSKIAAIGYCYGGYVVLNAAKLGADLKGVVSFHGNLSGVPVQKDKLKASILVLHGGDDKFVTEQEVNNFKHQMDSAGVNYTFKVYPGATHAFTNPGATALGEKFKMPIAYNAEADKNSWEAMKTFLADIFK